MYDDVAEMNRSKTEFNKTMSTGNLAYIRLFEGSEDVKFLPRDANYLRYLIAGARVSCTCNN